MIATAAPRVDVALWLRRAQLLAWLTIGYNLVEGLVAMGFGVAEESVALFGFGFDSFVEVASAVLVLWRLRGESGQAKGIPLERERRATLTIGGLFLLLAVSTAAVSALQLWSRSHPTTTLPGLIIAVLSLSFMFFLWSAKKRTAAVLGSATLESDAACSLACIQLSSVLLVGSLLFAIAPGLWWADAVAALLLSVLIGREGWQTVRHARSETFTGGCGCGGSCHDSGSEPA